MNALLGIVKSVVFRNAGNSPACDVSPAAIISGRHECTMAARFQASETLRKKGRNHFKSMVTDDMNLP